jgi:hypothetical protein
VIWHGSSLAAAMLIVAFGTARSDDLTCWGNAAPDSTVQGITCTALTESFLLSMRNATRSDVARAMGGAGNISGDNISFLSNHAFGVGGGSGAVRLIFGANGRVTTIQATIDRPEQAGEMRFVWTSGGSQCSDFPDSHQHCR